MDLSVNTHNFFWSLACFNMTGHKNTEVYLCVCVMRLHNCEVFVYFYSHHSQ